MDTKNLEKIIQLHEGYKQKVYKCPAGYLTVGIGRNVQTKGLSIQEALYLLRNDIQECQNLVTLLKNAQEAYTLLTTTNTNPRLIVEHFLFSNHYN